MHFNSWTLTPSNDGGANDIRGAFKLLWYSQTHSCLLAAGIVLRIWLTAAFLACQPLSPDACLLTQRTERFSYTDMHPKNVLCTRHALEDKDGQTDHLP